MSANSFKIKKSATIDPQAGSVVSEAGELAYNSATGKLELYNGAVDPIVNETKIATLSNKTLLDTTTAIADTVDPTKQILFNAAGTTGTSTTLTSSQTTNKTLTLPDATDTIVGKATTDSFTNKSVGDALTFAEIATPSTPVSGVKLYAKADNNLYALTDGGVETSLAGTTTFSDATFAINDSVDPTQQVKFNAAGTTGTSTTLLSSQTTNKVLTLPDATDTLVGKATTDVLTNKTIATGSNTITGASSKVAIFDGSGNLTTDVDLTYNGNQLGITATGVPAINVTSNDYAAAFNSSYTLTTGLRLTATTSVNTPNGWLVGVGGSAASAVAGGDGGFTLENLNVGTQFAIDTKGVVGTPLIHNANTGGSYAGGKGSSSLACIASGTYLPTTSNLNANMTSATANGNSSGWMRVGNMVFVHGNILVDVIAVGTATFEIDLPFGSIGASQLNGAANGNNNAQFSIGQATATTAVFTIIADATQLSQQQIFFTFGYQVA